ncbi:class I SAM-dependent methyltransferase [Alkaliphilus pronyensis]|uniref:Class I SAM-dependent methyltransferase n=1 Tax=Alkaliphilus pronyensis TaxID=1482732 RepID=A0A6I0FBL7_9FIRM|nr:class I SAM-dependent methyltransferase [Alkaliphilus pronyensis]KAB3537732.1 class I SAM-dependent methyltransferase [Alkaliphilus pronyensis]
MAFYSEFNKYYDEIFPTGKSQLRFISSRVPKNSKILDVACGTGNYSIALSEMGHEVFAVDLDEGMICQLNKKAENKKVKLHALVEDMKSIGEKLRPHSFNCIYCIGNSLVHLTEINDIYTVIKDIYNLLNQDGVMIIQTVNYDRILESNINHLPTIHNPEAGVKLVRRYQYDKDKHIINFNTQLVIETEFQPISYNNSVPLYPLRSFEIKELLNKIGFKEVKLYGDFEENEFNQKAFSMIIEARKG